MPSKQHNEGHRLSLSEPRPSSASTSLATSYAGSWVSASTPTAPSHTANNNANAIQQANGASTYIAAGVQTASQCCCPYVRQGYICPAHGDILRMQTHPRQDQIGHLYQPMERFLAEGPSEQSAMFNRADTGQASTRKACACLHECRGQHR